MAHLRHQQKTPWVFSVLLYTKISNFPCFFRFLVIQVARHFFSGFVILLIVTFQVARHFSGFSGFVIFLGYEMKTFPILREPQIIYKMLEFPLVEEHSESYSLRKAGTRLKGYIREKRRSNVATVSPRRFYRNGFCVTLCVLEAFSHRNLLPALLAFPALPFRRFCSVLFICCCIFCRNL